VNIKTVLKILGAAATGGFLALKLRKPRKKFDEFVALYDVIGIDYIHQIENQLIQALLPHVGDRNVDELDQLLDRQATYQEKLRFCQRNIPEFNSKAIRAICRLVKSNDSTNLKSALHNHSIEVDNDSLQLVVKELNELLSQCFDEAMVVNMPEKDRKEFKHFCSQKTDLKEKLTCFDQHHDSFGSVLFDTLSIFESKIFRLREEQ
jgi:hypothetical protein